jgi:hypothetical protein
MSARPLFLAGGTFDRAPRNAAAPSRKTIAALTRAGPRHRVGACRFLQPGTPECRHGLLAARWSGVWAVSAGGKKSYVRRRLGTSVLASRPILDREAPDGASRGAAPSAGCDERPRSADGRIRSGCASRAGRGDARRAGSPRGAPRGALHSLVRDPRRARLSGCAHRQQHPSRPVSWVFGTSRVSLVWLVVFAAILGWVLGLLVSALFRWRTRRRDPAKASGTSDAAR